MDGDTSNFTLGEDNRAVINRKLWDEIEEDLGEVTDFEIVSEKGLTEIKYKSNSIPKSILINGENSVLPFLQSFLYCKKVFATH